MKLYLSLGAMLLSVVAVIAILVTNVTVRKALATESKDDTVVWLFTPTATSEGELKLQVQVFGGLASGIETVTAKIGGETHKFEGRGIHWNAQLASKSGGRDSLDIVVPTGALEAGTDATLDLEVHYVSAEATDDGESFGNYGHDTAVSLTVPVAESLATARAVSGGLGGLALTLWALLWILGTRALRRTSQEIRILSLCTAWILALGPGIIAGYMLFALPLMAATALTATWFAVTATVVWAATPLLSLLPSRSPAPVGPALDPLPAE